MSITMSLLDAWPEGLLTTFSFDVSFFEAHLLPALQSRGARPIVIFLDHLAGLQPNASLLPLMGHAGVDYHLVPIHRAQYAFHPKVHLFTGPQAHRAPRARVAAEQRGPTRGRPKTRRSATDTNAVVQAREIARQYWGRGWMTDFVVRKEDPSAI